jgi:two-component system OmpR family sensor kinase
MTPRAEPQPGGPLARARALQRRTPLSVTLVAGLLLLVALALVVTGVAATTALRGYLLERVDEDLVSFARPTADQFDPAITFPRSQPRGIELPSEFYIQFTDSTGRVVGSRFNPLVLGDDAPEVPGLAIDEAQRRAGDPYSVGGPGDRWRVVVVPLSDDSGSIAVAASLDDVDSTLRQLRVIEFSVGLMVLVLLAVLGYLVVRSSLRPLAHVEATAAAIAAGDLSRRVPERDPRTEVGRLARAFNAMLAQIEAAFAARAASERAAKASEERMRRFVADASHELRTPLTSIRGFAELYRQGAATDPAAVERSMARVEAEARRMGVLVDDLLLLARLDQQRPLEHRPVDLVELAADAVHDARAVDPERAVRLRVLDGDTAPVVSGDDPRLRQVVANLVSNALTHTPPSAEVTVTVGATEEYAEIAVTDTGPGIPAADQARIFERFYRADLSRSRALGGTGLGLSIVAALVAAHGGTVDVTSEEGRGSTFRVRLPLAGASQGHTAEPDPVCPQG